MAFLNMVAADNANILHDPMIGVVLDKYEITELIDTGSWGNVYKAVNLTLGTVVAVKVIHKHVLKDKETIVRFRREARLLSCFESNNVIKVIDAAVEPIPYLVMEYFDGIPLNKWLKKNGPMSPKMAMDLFIQICSALAEAESFKIVHRDLKPANILIKTYGDTIEAKVLDFGLAKCLNSDATYGSRITATGEVIGSPSYMSPEQFKGECDTRSDIYSLGCIIYEMLAGRPAFSGQHSFDYFHKHLSTNPQPIVDVNASVKVEPGFEKVIFKCLEKAPKNRYQSAKICRLDLEAVRDRRKPNHQQADRHGICNFGALSRCNFSGGLNAILKCWT